MVGNVRWEPCTPHPNIAQSSQLFLRTTSCYSWVGSEGSTLGNQLHLELRKKKKLSEISLYDFPSDVLFIKYRVDASWVTLSRSQKASSPAMLPSVAFPGVEMWVLSPVTGELHGGLGFTGGMWCPQGSKGTDHRG